MPLPVEGCYFSFGGSVFLLTQSPEELPISSLSPANLKNKVAKYMIENFIIRGVLEGRIA